MNVIHRKLRHGREAASQRAIAATTGIPTPSLLPIVHKCPVGGGLTAQTVTERVHEKHRCHWRPASLQRLDSPITTASIGDNSRKWSHQTRTGKNQADSRGHGEEPTGGAGVAVTPDRNQPSYWAYDSHSGFTRARSAFGSVPCGQSSSPQAIVSTRQPD